MKAKILAAAAAGLLGSTTTNAAALYFDFNSNFHSPNASVFLFGASGQMATITNNAGFSENVVLNGDGFFNQFLPNQYQQSGTGVRNTGFQISSADPLAAYFVNRASATTDMAYILERGSLGTDYVIASQGGSIGEGSQVMIQAVEDNTTITFTPKGGAPIVQTLQAGETYKYTGGSTDLTGSFVSSDKDVAVSSGHECAQVPVGRVACDLLIEQMIPTDRLSNEYYVAASDAAGGAVGEDLVRVIATVDNTQVSVNGVVVATLDAGEVHEFSQSGNSGSRVTATADVAVAQYLIGTGRSGQLTDPAFSMVPGADSWLAEYRLATPDGAQAFNENYASIVIGLADLNSLMLDGVAVDVSGFTAIGMSGFARGVVDLPLGLFDLTADSEFLVMLGGGAQADSYFTYGGATFAPGISPPPPPPPGDVPAPGAIGLLGLGLLGLGLRRRRKMA
ncbi:IgGFc-binding protein [Pacificimonas sp. WHA3]|uniref:IgGFc-binding protein n=1 Tax=Pacificimonas pallii TaxID=2827236 RepID=A0ABS6SFZ2_9SPHN|nr:IgGFc-binding protein [Pacificimonas pallii]MBV7256772.1 IgGFc-binding protein [Pacificimonas pallii]